MDMKQQLIQMVNLSVYHPPTRPPPPPPPPLTKGLFFYKSHQNNQKHISRILQTCTIL